MNIQIRDFVFVAVVVVVFFLAFTPYYSDVFFLQYNVQIIMPFEKYISYKSLRLLYT